MKKRSIKIAGHATSVSLEEEFWAELKELAGRHGTSLSQLVEQIDAQRIPDQNLSSALRVYVLRTIKESRA